MIVYLNGRYTPAAEASISIADRGFLYGDGVFETCRWYETGFFRFAEHMRRLAAGARSLRLELPPLPELQAIAQTLADDARFEHATLRVTLTRGTTEPTLLATLQPLPGDWRAAAARGWALITARVRHPPAAALPSHIKSIGRVHGLLARFEAQDAGADDALLLAPDGAVVEGPTWNIFWRTGRTLYTPGLETGILEGVTRATLLELAHASGWSVREGSWPVSAVLDADEVCATMTSLGLVPIHQLDTRAYAREEMKLPETLGGAYWQAVRRDVAGTRA